LEFSQSLCSHQGAANQQMRQKDSLSITLPSFLAIKLTLVVVVVGLALKAVILLTYQPMSMYVKIE